MRFPFFCLIARILGQERKKTERRRRGGGGWKRGRGEGKRKLRSKHFCWATHAGVNEANFCIACTFTESEFG